jgi:hypothetical protein
MFNMVLKGLTYLHPKVDEHYYCEGTFHQPSLGYHGNMLGIYNGEKNHHYYIWVCLKMGRPPTWQLDAANADQT